MREPFDRTRNRKWFAYIRKLNFLMVLLLLASAYRFNRFKHTHYTWFHRMGNRSDQAVHIYMQCNRYWNEEMREHECGTGRPKYFGRLHIKTMHIPKSAEEIRAKFKAINLKSSAKYFIWRSKELELNHTFWTTVLIQPTELISQHFFATAIVFHELVGT